MNRFDLTREPWVQLYMLDGTTREVSLREAFALAPQARAVAGELPTTGFAVLRLMLAILYRSLGGAVTEQSWAALWADDDLPTGEIGDYLDLHRRRFDLLDPHVPFFQVADLRTARVEVAGLGSLIADVPNGIPFQTTRCGAALKSIGFAEAARWVVHAQAFETSGIKSAAVGDERTKGGRGYPIGTGWAGALGGVFAEGANLRQTLLLNLVGYEGDPEEEPDLPPWEQEPSSGAASSQIAPQGPVGAYTWQKARIRLVTEHQKVIGVVLSNGDRAILANQFDVEPMTSWYFSDNQTKANGGKTTYLPARHDPARSFWRGISGILPNIVQPQSSSGHPSRRAPGVTQWLSRLVVRGFLDAGFVIRLHAVGMIYGTQNAVVTDIVDDAYSLDLAVLSDADPAMGQVADWGVDIASKACWALGVFAQNVASSEVGDNPGDSGKARMAAAKDAATTTGFAALETAFRSWVASLHTASDIPAARREWAVTVERAVSRTADELARSAAPRTLTQRPAHLMCLPLAQLQLRRHLRMYLPLPPMTAAVSAEPPTEPITVETADV